MTTKHKTFEIKVLDRRKDGGRIVVSTGSVDRDRDRVFPQGAKTEDYLRNPVVQWGHNYSDPWATVGRTQQLEITETGIVADFTLRPAANDQDPQNIVLLLWDGDWIRTASIGFQPETAVPNDFGGLDFTNWGLLEWSLVPIPANQDALRLAEKTYPKAYKAYQAEIEKRGARHSAKDQEHIQAVHDHAVELGADCAAGDEEGDGKAFRRRKEAAIEPGSALAWVRRMEAISDLGTQQLYAVFRSYTIAIPKDATTLRCDDEGNIVEVPDPDAGKSITRKEVVFVPPLAYTDDDWGEDATYSISNLDCADDELVKGSGGDWEVVYLSEPIDSISVTKAARQRKVFTVGLRIFTQRGLERAKAALRRAPRAAGHEDDDDARALLAQLDKISAARRN
jgi:hypothetical protein